MKVSFDVSVSSPDKEKRLYWIGVLWKLVDEFNPDRPGLTNQDFHKWLYSNWKVTVLIDHLRPKVILGVDIEDNSVSMLLLKYPLSHLSNESNRSAL